MNGKKRYLVEVVLDLYKDDRTRYKLQESLENALAHSTASEALSEATQSSVHLHLVGELSD